MYSNYRHIPKILKMEHIKTAKPHTCGLCPPPCCNYIRIMYRKVWLVQPRSPHLGHFPLASTHHTLNSFDHITRRMWLAPVTETFWEDCWIQRLITILLRYFSVNRYHHRPLRSSAHSPSSLRLLRSLIPDAFSYVVISSEDKQMWTPGPLLRPSALSSPDSCLDS